MACPRPFCIFCAWCKVTNKPGALFSLFQYVMMVLLKVLLKCYRSGETRLMLVVNR
jgi:hypothetical protein